MITSKSTRLLKRESSNFSNTSGNKIITMHCKLTRTWAFSCNFQNTFSRTSSWITYGMTSMQVTRNSSLSKTLRAQNKIPFTPKMIKSTRISLFKYSKIWIQSTLSLKRWYMTNLMKSGRSHLWKRVRLISVFLWTSPRNIVFVAKNVLLDSMRLSAKRKWVICS